MPTVLPVLDKAGKLLGFAEPVTRYAILDEAGAREASRLSGLRRETIKELAAAAADLDMTAEITRMAAALPASPAADVAGVISVSDQAREIAAGLAETPEARADRQRQEKLKVRRRQSAALDRITHALNGNRS